MNTYYIVEDDEGFWMTETPSPTDQVIHLCSNLSEAEHVLARYIQASQ